MTMLSTVLSEPGDLGRLIRDEMGKIKEIKEKKEIYIAHIKYGYTFKEIADFLGIHYSTVSKALKRFIERGKEN